MKKDIETRFTAWSFIAAAILLWSGWILSPHHIGEYIVASDFEKIGENVWHWIWMFRIHIFGWVAMAIALMAFVTISAKRPFRVFILPGVGMAIIGTMTLALASAFYYNFGAWGVGMIEGKSPTEIEEFMEGILYTNQYVTCFIRFGRIFSGVGLVLLGTGLVKWKIVSPLLGWFTILFGLTAMMIILMIPDNFEVYKPMFHLKVLWLMSMGIYLLLQGVHLPKFENS